MESDIEFAADLTAGLVTNNPSLNLSRPRLQHLLSSNNSQSVESLSPFDNRENAFATLSKFRPVKKVPSLECNIKLDDSVRTKRTNVIEWRIQL
jgi:hypothetical protein